MGFRCLLSEATKLFWAEKVGFLGQSCLVQSRFIATRALKLRRWVWPTKSIIVRSSTSNFFTHLTWILVEAVLLKDLMCVRHETGTILLKFDTGVLRWFCCKYEPPLSALANIFWMDFNFTLWVLKSFSDDAKFTESQGVHFKCGK